MGWTTCSLGYLGNTEWRRSGQMCGPELQGGEVASSTLEGPNKDKPIPSHLYRQGQEHEEGEGVSWTVCQYRLPTALFHSIPPMFSRKDRSEKGGLIPGRREQWWV